MVGTRRRSEEEIGGLEEQPERKRGRRNSRGSKNFLVKFEEREGSQDDSEVLADDLHTEVKLEPDVNLTTNEVIAKIRKIKPGEITEFHASMKLGWVQLCPFCNKEIGTLVDHVKSHHPERDHRQIRTMCPYIECSRLVVDIKNHIRMVHKKVRNYGCDECDALFVNNYQVKKHKEGVHSKGLRVKCDECDMMLKTTTLETHIKRVHRGVKPMVPCTEEGCGKVFGSKADLERHVLGMHMKWKAPCPECGKNFRMECLHQHIMTVHKGIYPFQCPDCEQGFQNQKGLNTHVRTRHQGIYLYCRATKWNGLECGKVILSEEGLINHIESKHLNKEAGKKTPCPQCEALVFTCYLSEHVKRTHLAESGLVCPVETCGQVASNREILRNHVDTKHKSLALEWCEDCEEFPLELAEHRKLRHETGLWEGTEFRPLYGIMLGTKCHYEGCIFMATGPTHLARHIKLSHELKVSLKCEMCGKKTFDLDKHIRVQHEKVKTLECEFCPKKFLTPFVLKKHKLTHTALDSRSQPCPQCGVEVTNMKQHERFVHQKDLPYACEEEGCETRFTSNHHLKKHMESVHEKAKLACPLCDKMIGVNSLSSHIKIVHDKRRDHTCPQCSKTFQNKSHLRNHVQRVHLNMKEECPECGKMVQDLHNHRQFVHLKVKNFPCKRCDTRCTTSTALKKHISSVHLDERVKCPECDDMVKHLAQHIRQRHREMKKKHQCPQCEKFFTCGTYLAKHVMRVHMEFRQTCQTCGLETKDLTRHQRMTDCGREGYIPRKLKGTRTKKSKILDTSIESLEPDEIVITEEMKQEIFDSSDEELDIEDDFDEEFEEMKERLDPNTDPEVQPSKITGDVNSRPESAASSIGDRGVSDRMQLRSSSRELEGGNTYTSRGASPVELENDNILLKSEEETPSPGTVMLDHVGSTNNNTHVKMEIRPSPEPVTVLF